MNNIDEYLEEMLITNRITDETPKTYGYRLRTGENGKPFRDWERTDITKHLKEIPESQRYNFVASLRSIMKWELNGRHKEHPAYDVIVKRKPPGPQPFVTPELHEEAMVLLVGCHYLTIRNRAILSLMWEGWVRRDEITGIVREHFSEEGGICSLLGKGGAWDNFAFGFSDESMADYQAWLDIRPRIAKPGIETLFVNRSGYPLTASGISDIFRRLRYKLNEGKTDPDELVKFSPHMYRRGGASYHREQGYSDADGIAQGRWKDGKMYRQYSQYSQPKSYREKRRKWNGNQKAN